MKTYEGRHPHVKWVDLKGDGVMSECAIMKKDRQGNLYFFEVGKLDNTDKQRLARIIQNRNAKNFELWDLMSQVTLNNGVNALDYFHQLVKVISPDGVIYNPKSGQIGTGKHDTKSADQRQADQEYHENATRVATEAANEALRNYRPHDQSGQGGGDGTVTE